MKMEAEVKLQLILELQDKGYPRQEIFKEVGYKRLDYMTSFLKKRGYVLVDEKYVLNTNTISNTQANTMEIVETNTQTNTTSNTNEQFIKVLDNKIVDLLRNDYDVLKDIIDRFKENTSINNSSIFIDLIDDRHLKQYPKAMRVNQFVWEEWNEFCKENKTFNKKDLVSMALKEYIKNHKK